MRTYLGISILIFGALSSVAQSNEDIVMFLRNRIESYSQRPASIAFSDCKLSVYNTMAIPGSLIYTLEMSARLNDLTDVMYVNDRQVWIVMKFKNGAVSYTDIENDGTRKFWKVDNEMNLFFSRGTLDNEEAKKMVALLKKLSKSCGATIQDL